MWNINRSLKRRIILKKKPFKPMAFLHFKPKETIGKEVFNKTAMKDKNP